jgi:starvation-inducible DNA-binding protein
MVSDKRGLRLPAGHRARRLVGARDSWRRRILVRSLRTEAFEVAVMTQTLEPKMAGQGTDQAPALQATLVELIDLSLQAKQAHWNVVGPAFKPVHEFLDELTGEYRDWYDMVAERLTAIGVAPDGRTATVSATTPLPGFPGGPIGDRAALAAVEERVTLVAAHLRERAQELGGVDVATQDLVIEILRGLEKQRWMLRAHHG